MSNSKQVRKSLETLPTEIHDFYEEALERIEDYSEEDRHLAKRTLAYVYCARRPLKLEELSHALSIETHDTELDEDALPEMEIVLSISAGLIRVNEKSNTVVLVHQTFQEYLAKNPSKLFHHPEAEIAKTCLTYLSMDVFEQGPCIEGEALEQRLEDYLFLDYASHHWGHHLIENDSPLWIDLLLKFLRDGKKIGSYLQVLHIPRYRGQDWHDRFPKQFSPLHVVAYWGLHWVLRMHLADYGDIDSQDSHGITALLLAAKHGHAVLVQMLVENGAELDTRNNREETAIYWAARLGHKSIVELLLAKGADPTIKDSEGWTALDWAVIKGYPELAQLLLDRGHHIDPEYSGENRALILAAEAGTETTVKMLLDLGAEVNWKDHFGSTALTWAIPEGHEKVVRLLLDNRADVNSRDVYDNAPLHWSLPYTEIVKLLLKNGADVDAKNDHGKTALIWSAHDGQEVALDLLLHKGADIAIQDCHGCTALHSAALKGHESITNALLRNGADANTKDQDGWTPLHAAALKQHLGVVRILLEKTESGEKILKWVESQQKDARKGALLAYIADRKSEGSTVVSGLGSAAQDGKFERVQALLETGVDINGFSACGSTALTLAVSQRQERIVRLLLEQGALVNKLESNGRSALHLAAEDGHHKIIQMLVENGANVNGSFHTWTPLLIAAREVHEKAVEYLVQNGANIDAEDYYGRKAIHWIAQHGDWKTLKLLAKYGANIDSKDHWNRTPLIWAVQGENLAAAKFLLNMGASLESKTGDGSTALHMASYLGDEEMVLLLLQRGADIEAKTRKGFRPLHIAVFLGHEEVAQLLLEEGGNIDAESHLLEDDDENGEDDESVRDGSVDTDDVDLRATLALDKYMYQCLAGEEKATLHSWTAHQLAVKSGSKATQKLLGRALKA